MQPETVLPPTENGASAPGVNGYAAPVPGDLMSSATGAAGALAGWAMSSISRKVRGVPPTHTSPTILMWYLGAAHDNRPLHRDRFDAFARYTFTWTQHIGPIKYLDLHPRLVRFHVSGTPASSIGVLCSGSKHHVQTRCSNERQRTRTGGKEDEPGRCTRGRDG